MKKSSKLYSCQAIKYTPPAPLSHNAYAKTPVLAVIAQKFREKKKLRPAVLFKLKPCAVIAQCVGEFCYFFPLSWCAITA